MGFHRRVSEVCFLHLARVIFLILHTLQFGSSGKRANSLRSLFAFGIVGSLLSQFVNMLVFSVRVSASVDCIRKKSCSCNSVSPSFSRVFSINTAASSPIKLSQNGSAAACDGLLAFCSCRGFFLVAKSRITPIHRTVVQNRQFRVRIFHQLHVQIGAELLTKRRFNHQQACFVGCSCPAAQCAENHHCRHCTSCPST